VIAPLRRRHRLWTGALALLVPAGFALAIARRPPRPELPAIPAALLDAAPAGLDALFAADVSVARVRMTARVLRGQGRLWLELDPDGDLRQPDVLVYWSPAAETQGRLPADSHLLGRLAGARARRLPLPAAAVPGSGQIVLYSLGHQELVGALPLPGPASEAARPEGP
jgi:hypothetical protein